MFLQKNSKWCVVFNKLFLVFNLDMSIEQKLQDHTEASVKRREPGIQKLATSYNNLCIQMVALLRQGKAPQGSVAPLPISRDGLFKLDVDDDIWQDIGLDDDSNGLPPAWLADEKVRLGIRSLLELRRCEEEENRLLKEKGALIEWVTEEWNRLHKSMLDAGKEFHHTGVHKHS